MATQVQGKKKTSFWKGFRSEIKKVTWPTRPELIKKTGVVIFVSLAMAILIWLLDTAMHGLLSLIIGA